MTSIAPACGAQSLRRNPYLILAILALVCSGSFSILLFPQLVVPLKVHYMMADGYYPIAANIVAGKGFEMGGEPRFDRGAFKREPFYPLFLAALMATGHFVPALLCAQILLYIGTVLLAYRVFKDWGRPRVAFLAALLFGMHPYAYWYVAKPTPENFSPILVLANIWICQTYLADRKTWKILLWGALCGLAVLVKSQLLVLFPIGLVLLVWRYGWRSSLVPATAALLVCLAVLSPWAIRNYRLSGRLMVSSSLFGPSFFVGNENASWRTIQELSFHRRGETLVGAEWKAHYAKEAAAAAGGTGADKYVLEAQIDAEYSHRVLPWIVSHKAAFVRKLLINMWLLWFIADEPAKSALIGLSLAPLLATCVVGMLELLRRRGSLFEMQALAIICVLYASYMAILAMGRYMHVCLALECYLSVLGIRALLLRFQVRFPRAIAWAERGQQLVLRRGL